MIGSDVRAVRPRMTPSVLGRRRSWRVGTSSSSTSTVAHR